MTASMFFLLVATIFIAPHTSESVARFGTVLMLGMFFLAVLVENLK